MIQVNLILEDEEKSFNLPTDWSEVSVEQFAQIFSFNRDEKNAIEISVKILTIFMGISEDDLMAIDYHDFLNLIDNISFTNKEIEGEPVEYVDINDERYYLKSDFSKLTMGEVISIEMIINSSNGNLFSVMPQLLAIFLRKKKENGELEKFKSDFMNRQELFKSLNIKEVYPLFVFFLTGGNLSDINTKDYLEKQ